ncbi:hypothetical protein ABH922_004088 [Rhodococcus sp. 27YEA15]
MSKLRVRDIAMSLNGYLAGSDQSLDRALEVDGLKLFD